MQDDIFVIDGVTHCYDMRPENFAEPRYAEPINELQKSLYAMQPPGYDLDPEATAVDYPIDDTAGILFRESRTDVAIYHPLPIYFYKDGLSGFEKGLQAIERWPDRFIGSYVTVDPMRPDPIGDLERQFAAVDAVGTVMGLKLYPISYYEGKTTPWQMDDPKIGFPLYERALELGLRNIAIHKSLPLGPAPEGDAFHPRDVEGAADAFPNITFEVVHGGMSFTEEMAWLFGRMPNIWLNLETFNIILSLRPEVFGDLLATLLTVTGEAGIERMFWSSGTNNCHARPGLEAFMDFQFADDQMNRNGLFTPVPQLSHEHKRAILGGNLARLHGLDVEALKGAIADDEFSRATADGLAEPYSTTTMAGKTMSPFPGVASHV
ncbi:MAG TPA: amidohydrolase family protein [Solirubrobacterales bacterium]|nr:amidohydrolase family protein [Solirubrobacterales bacterium]